MKKSMVALCVAAVPFVANANETELSKKFDLNIRRIGVDLSMTRVGHPAEYADSPISAFTAKDQDFIKGVFDVALEYTKNKFSWDNSLFMEYGRTTLKPYNEPETVDENADKILASSELSYECWQFGGLKFGPTNRAQYQTEFVAGPAAPRQNLVRDSIGISLFDHKILKSLYLAGLYEYDFTYTDNKVSKVGAELGWRVEYEIRQGVAFRTDGYYREYFGFSTFEGTDLVRDLSLTARLDTNLWGDFTFGPYIQYRLGLDREADKMANHPYASNMTIGVSFNYITKFGLL